MHEEDAEAARAGAGATWEALTAPWKRAFEEAWASFCAGSAGVGAVVVDGSGEIVSAGRNCMFEDDPEVSPLAGSRMAHAEMVALQQMRRGDFDDHEIYSTFEPCLMCAATIRMHHLRRVHFAAVDPLWDGLEEAFRSAPVLARRMPERTVLGGPFGVFGHVLHLCGLGERMPEIMVTAHGTLAPELLVLGRRLERDGRLTTLSARAATVDLAVAELWDDLSGAAALAGASGGRTAL